jgi:hypothetical protein
LNGTSDLPLKSIRLKIIKYLWIVSRCTIWLH